MIPNMYKIAGELTAGGAARGRAVAGGAGAVDLRRPLRRDGGAPDRLRAARLGLGAGGARPGAGRAGRDAATRVPFVHFFDGFRTSHELNTIELLADDDLRALVPEELVRAHRGRALSPGAAVHPRHRAEPGRLLPGARDGQPVLRPRPGRRAGRDGRASPSAPAARYQLVDYSGHPEAERVIVLMGSGGETARETVGVPQRARRAGRRGAGAALPAVPGAGAGRRRCPRPCAASPCSTGPRSPARSASRCSSTWSRRSARRTPTASGQ